MLETIKVGSPLSGTAAAELMYPITTEKIRQDNTNNFFVSIPPSL
jgi:hypothetical protein